MKIARLVLVGFFPKEKTLCICPDIVVDVVDVVVVVGFFPKEKTLCICSDIVVVGVVVVVVVVVDVVDFFNMHLLSQGKLLIG